MGIIAPIRITPSTGEGGVGQGAEERGHHSHWGPQEQVLGARSLQQLHEELRFMER